MRKITLGVAAVLAGCLAVVVLVAVQLWPDRTDSGITGSQFPRKLAWRTLLPGVQRGELVRRVLVDEKGFALQEIIEFTNGDTGLILYAADGSFDAYRFDGTVKLPEPVKEAPMTGRINYRTVAAGGRQLLQEINYRPDGSELEWLARRFSARSGRSKTRVRI